jgi:hypothetical protein
MSGPTHERSPHFLPGASPRRSSRPLLVTSALLLTLWATVLALMAFRLL